MSLDFPFTDEDDNADRPLLTNLSKEAQEFLKSHSDEISMTDNGKLRFVLTGMEFPMTAERSALERYFHGRAMRRARVQQTNDQFDFDSVLPHIVPHRHKNPVFFMYCQRTNKTLPKDAAVIRKHIKGRRYQVSLKLFQEQVDLRKERKENMEKRRAKMEALQNGGPVSPADDNSADLIQSDGTEDFGVGFNEPDSDGESSDVDEDLDADDYSQRNGFSREVGKNELEQVEIVMLQQGIEDKVSLDFDESCAIIRAPELNVSPPDTNCRDKASSKASTELGRSRRKKSELSVACEGKCMDVTEIPDEDMTSRARRKISAKRAGRPTSNPLWPDSLESSSNHCSYDPRATSLGQSMSTHAIATEAWDKSRSSVGECLPGMKRNHGKGKLSKKSRRVTKRSKIPTE